MNAADVLLGAHDSQRTALVCGSEQVSYGALRDTVARTAAALHARGIAPDEPVAIKLPDGPAWVSAFLGTLWAGAIAVPVNPRIPAAEWDAIVAEAHFRWIVAESRDDAPPAWRERVVPLADWQREVASASPIPAAETSPEAPAFWTHSSGTSGKPKAVVHAHCFATAIERVSAEALGIGPDDRLFASSKLFFAYPQTNSLYAGLKLGATVILDPQWPTAEGVAATVAAQRPTVLFSVPSLYRNLLKDGLAPKIAACGVRLCVSAGEALAPSLRDEWRRQTGLTIANGYGASETLVLVLVCVGDREDFAPSPGVAIEPLGDAGSGLPTRLCIRTPSVALGYRDRPEAQTEHFRDGAFCPADLFVQTANGGWRFAGREDSLVKIRGRWVNLVELEERLTAGLPDVVEAATVSVADSDGVDAVALFYVAKPAAEAAVAAALQSRVDALPHYQRPRWLHPIAALPRTATGKLIRRRLQELHASAP
jgi:acyl-coenzyme A synthetase/AMP-(fatty) acid ligase